MEAIMKTSAKDMDTTTTERKPSAFTLLQCKCPRCRKGDMFANKNPWHLKNTMKMHPRCIVCNQSLDIEPGFYFGSSYVSYALTVALSVATLVAWWVIIGISINDNSIFHWLVFNAVFLLALQPYLMRVARTGWLAFFVRYDKHWKTNPPTKGE